MKAENQLTALELLATIHGYISSKKPESSSTVFAFEVDSSKETRELIDQTNAEIKLSISGIECDIIPVVEGSLPNGSVLLKVVGYSENGTKLIEAQ